MYSNIHINRWQYQSLRPGLDLHGATVIAFYPARDGCNHCISDEQVEKKQVTNLERSYSPTQGIRLLFRFATLTLTLRRSVATGEGHLRTWIMTNLHSFGEYHDLSGQWWRCYGLTFIFAEDRQMHKWYVVKYFHIFHSRS